jgi:hypothetical protein
MASEFDTTNKQDVVLHVAALLLNEQHSAISHSFSSHLITLQDIYHEGFSRLWNAYELAAMQAVPPVLPSTEATPSEAIERALAEFNVAWSNETERNRAGLAEWGDKAHSAINELKTAHAEAERKRSDEFFEVASVCRRELQATISLVKAEVSATNVFTANAGTLQLALEARGTEIRDLNKRIQSMRESHEAEVKTLQAQFDAERGQWGMSRSADRNAVDASVRQLSGQLEAEHAKHVADVASINARHNAVVEKLTALIEDRDRQVETLHARIEDGRRRELDAINQFNNERTTLHGQISQLRVDVERTKSQLEQKSTDAELQRMSQWNRAEQQRVHEMDAYKRRLADAITSGSAADDMSPRSGFGSPSPYQSARRASSDILHISNAHLAPVGPSSPLRLDPHSPQHLPPARLDTLLSPGSRSPSTLANSARSPSEAYSRLQNLSASLRAKVDAASLL